LAGAAASLGVSAPATDAEGALQEMNAPGAYPEGAVLLNFNENPLGPSPRAVERILKGGLERAHRYNDIGPATEAIARHHGVSPKQVLLGCGSTEFLHISPWTFLRGGGSLLLPNPTYDWSAGVAEAMGAKVVRVPLGPQGETDVAALRKSLDAATRLVYLANPNNPTGASIAFDQLRSLVEAMLDPAVLLVDEAYSHFLPQGKTAIDLVREGAPVVAARTFSKAFGLAGLRLGYVIAPDTLIEKLKTFWLLDLGINSAAAAACEAALDDRAHCDRYVRVIDEGLQELRDGFKRLRLSSLPHRAPFVMVDLGREAKPIVADLARRKVYVRDGRAWEMPTYLRVSIGLGSDHHAFLDALGRLLA
jgi:histidinol-phosphate aminotransferase